MYIVFSRKPRSNEFFYAIEYLIFGSLATLESMIMQYNGHTWETIVMQN